MSRVAASREPDPDYAAYRQAFGERVTRAMEAGGVTRKQIALALTDLEKERLGSESLARRIANGQLVPRADKLALIAAVLGVTVDYLIGNAEHPRGVVVPGWGEVEFAPASAESTLSDLASGAEQHTGRAASRRPRDGGTAPTPVRPRRARPPKPE